MVADATTFALAFATVFGAILWGLWRMEKRLDGLQVELRVRDMATSAKNDDEEA